MSVTNGVLGIFGTINFLIRGFVICVNFEESGLKFWDRMRNKDLTFLFVFMLMVKTLSITDSIYVCLVNWEEFSKSRVPNLDVKSGDCCSKREILLKVGRGIRYDKNVFMSITIHVIWIYWVEESRTTWFLFITSDSSICGKIGGIFVDLFLWYIKLAMAMFDIILKLQTLLGCYIYNQIWKEVSICLVCIVHKLHVALLNYWHMCTSDGIMVIVDSLSFHKLRNFISVYWWFVISKRSEWR